MSAFLFFFAFLFLYTWGGFAWFTMMMAKY